MGAIARGCVAVFVMAACAGPTFAQEAKSATLAKQLAAALDAAKLDSIAAKDPSNPDIYIGALYLPGLQLLMISSKYAAPQLLDARLTKKEYRDVYIDLNGSPDAATRVFIEDTGIDGLKAKHEGNQGSDSFEGPGKKIAFDGDWRKQKLSEDEYLKTYSDADQRYATMLTALLDQLKK